MRFRRSAPRTAAFPFSYVSRFPLIASMVVAAAVLLDWPDRSDRSPRSREGDLDLAPSPYSELGQDVFLTGTSRAADAAAPNEAAEPAAADAFGVDRQLLMRVLDKTKGIPERPYFHLVNIATRNSAEALRQHAQGEDRVTYANLWTQPEKHRGELIYLEGRLRGLARLDVTQDKTLNPSGLTGLYQGDLFTTAAHPRPYILVTPEIPQGMPQGMNISENVTFAGFFLKQWRYKSAGDVDRAAPLLIGRFVTWRPAPPHERASPFRTYAGWGIVLGVSALGAVVWLMRRWLHRGSAKPASVPGADRASVMSDLEQLETRELRPATTPLDDDAPSDRPGA